MTNPYYLGIDTGGTFTDGVLFDPHAKQVVRSVKVHTTHHDLSQCIRQVIEELLQGETREIAFISLSTTLATNAIAEGKRKPVALLLLGYDAELVYHFKFHQEFGTSQYFFLDGSHDAAGKEQKPLDRSQILKTLAEIKDRVDALAVSAYAGPVNPDHEEQAGAILSQESALPVVQAHHLSSELDSIRRAITASLNASLLSNTQAFIEAVQEMLKECGLASPILIVKGNGSVIQADYARKRPVEIVHSGPATSAIGGQFLSGVETALVIDIGGTTTDLVVVEGGRFQAYQQAATVGTFRTCVHTIQTRSIGLGGDSLIRFDHWRNLEVGPERAVPLAWLCATYPEAKQDLERWLRGNGSLRYSDQLEYWILQGEPRQPPQDDRIRKALNILKAGPRRMRALMEQVGVKSPVLLDRDDLIRSEIIQRAGLTPTDLLHATGEYTPWDAEAARLAAEVAARMWDEDAPAFAERVKEAMARQIVAEIMQFLSSKTLSDLSSNGNPKGMDQWLFTESLERRHPYLGCRLQLKIPIVGIGAPAKSFLPRVAQALGTEIIFPEHYAVANAVGTVVGNVIIRQEGQVNPCIEGTLITGYFARVPGGQHKFPSYNEALDFVKEDLEKQVREEAIAAGAGNPYVECVVKPIWDGMATVLVTAIGKPGN